MTTTDPLAAWIDRSEIAELIPRWGVVLDEQRFADLASIFAPNAAITTPGGHAEGIDAIVAQASRNHDPDVRTQHVATDLVVDLNGDRARARGNFLVVFVAATGSPVPPPQFQVGAVYHLELVRTALGWRIDTLEMRPVWAAGERP